MRQHVTMFCEYSGAPEVYWSQYLWFIGNAKSYRVWSQNDEQPKRVLLKHAHTPLTWRQMIADIHEMDDIGLGGDLLDHIHVTGIGGFVAGLLKLAWCKFDGPGEAQLEFLLQRQDSTLALLAPGLGNVADADVLNAVGEVAEAAEKFFVPPSIVERGLRELAPILEQGLEAWVDAMWDWLEQHQPPGLTKGEVAALNTSEELADLVQGPSPADPEVVAALLTLWLKVDPKPVAYGHTSDIGTESTAAFFRWLVARVGTKGYHALKAIDCDAAKKFAEAFVAHAKMKIHWYETSSGGGAIGAGMRRVLARDWERLIEEVIGQMPVDTSRR